MPRASLTDAASLDPGSVAAWRDLAGRAIEPNPFARPEFVLPAARTRGDAVTLAVVREGERWLACLPLKRAAAWERLPVPSLAPWLPAYAYLATPLVDRDAAGWAMDALVELAVRARSVAALVLDPFDPAGPLGDGLARSLAARGLEAVVYADFERAALRRRPEPTYVEEALSSSGRKKLRWSRRALGRELGAEPEVVDRSAEPAAWRAFLEMEQASWKGEAGTALASRPGDAAFFEAMCASMSDAGLLQLLSLEAGGRVAAMHCNVVDGDHAYVFKVAYDPELGRYSPGVLLWAEAAQAFHERTGLSRVDSCAAPDNEPINRMWPDRRRLQTLIIPTGASGGRYVRAAVVAEDAARQVRRRLRRATATAPAGG